MLTAPVEWICSTWLDTFDIGKFTKDVVQYGHDRKDLWYFLERQKTATPLISQFAESLPSIGQVSLPLEA